jgi:transposase
MQTISTLGLDIAKSVFQVHGVDAAGQVVIRRQLNVLPELVVARANSGVRPDNQGRAPFSEMSMRLDECPGVGPVLATALVAAAADPKAFRSGPNFSA